MATKGKMIPVKKENFKPCSNCPSPSKCKAAGECLKQAGK
jgi:hypothetical protein